MAPASSLRAAIAAALVAIGHVVMIGSAFAVPAVYIYLEPGLVELAIACALVMLAGFTVIWLGDKVAPAAAATYANSREMMMTGHRDDFLETGARALLKNAPAPGDAAGVNRTAEREAA